MSFRYLEPYATLLPFNILLVTFRILREKDDSKRRGLHILPSFSDPISEDATLKVH